MKKNTKKPEPRHAAILVARSRSSAGFMGDRRKKRSKERQNIMEGW